MPDKVVISLHTPWPLRLLCDVAEVLTSTRTWCKEQLTRRLARRR